MQLIAHLVRAVPGWLRLAPGRHPWWAAGTATVALGVPLALTLWAEVPELAAPATFGALANLYGRNESYARRWRTQAWTGLGLTLAVLAGAGAAVLPLTGWADVLVPAVVVAVVATVAKFVTDAVRTGPPAGLIPVFAAGTLGVEPLTLADLPAVAAVSLTCAALAVALSAAAGLWRPDGPERNAVARALAAVLHARRCPGDPRAETAAVAAVHAAWGVLGPGPEQGTCGPLPGWLAHAERVLHAGAPERPLRVVLPTLAGRRPVPAAPAGRFPAAAAWPRRRVWTALREPGVLHAPAVRVGIACAAATLLASALGFGHVYWAAVAAAAVLQSPSAGTTTQRAVQRGAGTLVGVGLAAALVPLATDDVRLWLLTALCMFAVEFCMPRNYAIGTIAITGLSLLLTRLGTSGAGVSTLVLDRVADTVLGVLVAVVVAVLVRNRYAHRSLADALDALRAAGLGPHTDPHAVRRHLLSVAEARARLHDDDWRVPAPRTQAEEQAAYRRLGDLLRTDTPQAGTPEGSGP
ncbi:FUSC family protein [Kineococcus sp. SYSU DK003]|uniref:FUSC family protein n=1 Tax=Kineococcus sp. SYSU DK003 TaxID=3383124 RepID=UPI003D7CCAEA